MKIPKGRTMASEESGQESLRLCSRCQRVLPQWGIGWASPAATVGGWGWLLVSIQVGRENEASLRPARRDHVVVLLYSQNAPVGMEEGSARAKQACV